MYPWVKEQTKPITVFEAVQKGDVQPAHATLIPTGPGYYLNYFLSTENLTLICVPDLNYPMHKG